MTEQRTTRLAQAVLIVITLLIVAAVFAVASWEERSDNAWCERHGGHVVHRQWHGDACDHLPTGVPE